MPTKRPRLSRTERAEYLTTGAQLGKAGISTGAVGGSWLQRRRFTLEQVDPELARVFDLPDGSVAVAFFAKLTVKNSGVMFTDATVFPPWEHSPLDLYVQEDLEDKWYWDDVIGWSPVSPPTILNRLLVGRSTPLPRCQQEGLIIAAGWSTSMMPGWTSVPTEYRDEQRVAFQLCLEDEQGLESEHKFVARVDRSVRRRYERRRPTQQEIAARLAKRRPLFERETDQTWVQRVAPGEAGPELLEQSPPGCKHRVTI